VIQGRGELAFHPWDSASRSVPISAAAQEEQDRRDDEDDHEDRSNDADAKCCDHDRASLFKSAQTRTIGVPLMMTLPSACEVNPAGESWLVADDYL
jgi:hypothetical protein